MLLDLCAELGPVLNRQTRRTHPILVPVQVLTTLGFLATEAFQWELAERYVCNYFHFIRLLGTITWDYNCIFILVIDGAYPSPLWAQVSTKHIKLPVEEEVSIKRQFAAMCSFPNVIVLLIALILSMNLRVSMNLPTNWKHLINAQMTQNLVARWPGSTDYSLILWNSRVGESLQAGAVHDGWLLGD